MTRQVAHVLLGEALPGAAKRMQCDAAGFLAATLLHERLATFQDTNIVVDFSPIAWIDGHLTAALDTIFRLTARNGNVVRLSNMAPRLRATFCKNGLIIDHKVDRFNTVMPLAAFQAEDDHAFSAYTKRHLDRPEMPRMGRSLRCRFFEGIDELFANAAFHSGTELPIVVGGQFYPRAHRLTFCISDAGRGIQEAVRNRLGQSLSASEAIDWAMQPYNTTRRGDIPGGLGSHVLREFIEANGGQMTVVSNDGFWTQHGASVIHRDLPSRFPGTVVVIEIDTANRRSYDLVEAPRPDEIW